MQGQEVQVKEENNLVRTGWVGNKISSSQMLVHNEGVSSAFSEIKREEKRK